MLSILSRVYYRSTQELLSVLINGWKWLWNRYTQMQISHGLELPPMVTSEIKYRTLTIDTNTRICDSWFITWFIHEANRGWYNYDGQNKVTRQRKMSHYCLTFHVWIAPGKNHTSWHLFNILKRPDNTAVVIWDTLVTAHNNRLLKEPVPTGFWSFPIECHRL